jgi:hypothetical protein
MKFFLILILITFSIQTFGQAVVKSIHSSNEILVDLRGALGFFSERRVLIMSQKEDKIIAIGKIRDSFD